MLFSPISQEENKIISIDEELIRKNCARRFLNPDGDLWINAVYDKVEEYVKDFLDNMNDPEYLNLINDPNCEELLREELEVSNLE